MFKYPYKSMHFNDFLTLEHFIKRIGKHHTLMSYQNQIYFLHFILSEYSFLRYKATEIILF